MPIIYKYRGYCDTCLENDLQLRRNNGEFFCKPCYDEKLARIKQEPINFKKPKKAI